MSLLEQIQKDYLAAMKERNEVKKSALNYVIAQIKNKKIEIQKELEDVDVIKILKKEINLSAKYCAKLQLFYEKHDD